MNQLDLLVDALPVTGKRKPKVNRAGDATKSNLMDRCQTPAHAILPLLPYLKWEWTVWESAAGEGYLAAALSSFCKVVTSDVLTGQSFFSYEPESYDVMITNPPYTIKYKWLQRCYELGKPFALLLPVETIGAKTAQKLFRKHGVEVIFMDRRINFKMPNIGWSGSSAQFPVAWFTHGLNIGRDMTFFEFAPEPNVQLALI